MAVILLLLVSLGISVTKSTGFQTYLIQQYLKSLAKKLHSTITIESVKVSFFNGVTLNKLYVEDLHQDTLAFINELNVGVKQFSFKEKKIIVDDVNLKDVYFNLKKYKQDTTLNLAFIIDHFKSTDTTSSKWEFGLNNVDIENGRFNYNNEHAEPLIGQVDYQHIGIQNLNLKTSDIEFIPEGVNCNINQFSLIEKSGFDLKNLATEFNISPKGIITQNLHIKTNLSDVNGNVTFITNEYADMAEFVEKVNIKSYFENSEVNFSDICHFVPALECINKSVKIDGEVKGRISNLKGRKLVLQFDKGTSLKGDLNISGLPDMENTFMHLNIDELITSERKLAELPIFPFCEGNTLKLPSNFKNLGNIHFKGNLTGFYYDFVAYGTFHTSIGSMSTDISLKTINEKITYKGQVKSRQFDLGQFFGVPKQFGPITMDVKIDGEGVDLDELKANMEGEINQVEIRGYDYNNVEVKGDFENKIFNGWLAVKDKNIDFDFNGLIDFSHQLPIYKFSSDVHYAKLENLNLIELPKKMKTIFSTYLEVDLEGNHIDNLKGEIKLCDLNYLDKIDSIYVKEILLNSEIISNNKKLTIDSDVLKGEIKGMYTFKELIDASTNNLVKYIPSFKNENLKQVEIANDFEFNLDILNTDLLSKVLLKGVRLGENSTIQGFYFSENQSLKLNAHFPTIDANGIKINELQVEGKTIGDTLLLDVLADKIYQNDSIYIDNFKTSSIVQNDTILTHVKWNNQVSISRTEADIHINTFFRGYNDFTTHFYNTNIYIDDTLWTVNENNLIHFFQPDTMQLTVASLGFSAQNQSILIDGKLSGKPTDQIDVALKNFNLKMILKFVPHDVLKINGLVNGVASVKKENEEFIFTSDLNFNKLVLNETNIGDGEVKSAWSTNEKKLFVDGSFYKGHIPTIIFKGNYFPFKEEESLDLMVQLQRTDLQIISSYTQAFVSNLRGIASAEVKINGIPTQPIVNGYIQLQKTSFEVNYLKTNFSTPSCRINIVPDMISFDNVLFFDATGRNRAYTNGTIFHEWYKNFSFDIGMDANEFLAMNTTEKDNNLYYGKAFLSGLVNIGGYNNQLNIDLDVKTEKGTIINIPLDDNEEVTENNFIEFINKDTIQIEKEEEIDLSNILMNFDLEATPDAEVRLVFDEQIGDVMKARGEGDLSFIINQQGDFNIYGDYKIKDGDYLFTLQNIINKRFDLEEGGKIVWNGDPYDAQLDLTAVYRLRARLYELLASTEDSASASVYKKRTPVNLKLIMTKSMLKPDIAFDIDLPTADETTRNKVKSILYVSDQQENIQELNKQVFSLLVLNQFIAPTGQGTAGGGYGNVAGTTSFELMSNQLSNWLSKISNDFDIGFNYRPGDEISGDEVQLALSTQIFNDRLILDGNFGVSGNKEVSTESQNTNNLIGDFSMEYKITEDGKLRVKAFNVSNQSYLERTSSNYTQGIGLFYRKEFDKFSDLFKKGIKSDGK